jgi:cell division protein FtsB
VIPAAFRRPATGFATLLLTALLLSSVFGSGGLVQLVQLHQERRALGEQAFALLEKNDDLRRGILQLRRSDRVLERLARQELGLVREGEIVYRFRAPESPATDDVTPAASFDESSSIPGAVVSQVTRPR